MKIRIQDTWFHPRYINKRYTHNLLLSLKNHASGTMLDIGCGLRPYKSLFQERITRYIGIDWPVSPEKAAVDIVGNALYLPVLNDAADTVLATELLEHLPEPERFIAEVARVLRQGGSFILTVPFMEALHEEPRDYFRFTPHGLKAMLEGHGFSLIKIFSKGGLSAVLGSFLTQSIYELANPANEQGVRRNSLPRLIIALPCCFLFQVVAYAMDRWCGESKYSLGYVVLATLNRK